MALKILIDTNIFIQLEEPDNTGFLRKDFAEFSQLAKKHGISLFCHPGSENDLNHDLNLERKRNSLINYSAYPKIVNPPESTLSELEILFKGIRGQNDLIDCQILYALKCDCAEFLISQDEGLRSRAKYAGLGNRLFSIKEAISYVKSLFEPNRVKPPQVLDLFVYELKDDEKILKSISSDYHKFSDWLAKCKREHRKAWVVKSDLQIAGLVIYKDENAELEYPGFGKKSLKLCTFKVDEEFRGSKIGELLLKTAFNFCVNNGYDSVYLTAYSKHGYLIEFLKDFGFEVLSKTNSNGELIFYKKFYKEAPLVGRMDPLDFHKKYSPYVYGDSEIKKFIVPIQPEFHEILFPELVKQQVMFSISPTASIPGNTIKKVYICHAPITTLEPGSLVIFYKSKESHITTLGIVERVLRTELLSQAIRQIGKRSVYSFDQIESMVRKPLLIIDFRLVVHLKVEISLRDLKKMKVLLAQPQSITTLKEPNFEKLKQYFTMITD